MTSRHGRTPLPAHFHRVSPIAPDGVQHHHPEQAEASGWPVAPALARLAAFLGSLLAPATGLDPAGRLLFPRQRQTCGARWR